MTRSDGIRLVTELEANKILLARGHTKIDCVICGGTGALPIAAANDAERPLGSTGRVWRRSCHNCEGAGWRWQEPETPRETAKQIST